MRKGHADFAEDTIVHRLLGPAEAANCLAAAGLIFGNRPTVPRAAAAASRESDRGGLPWAHRRRRRRAEQDCLGRAQHALLDGVRSSTVGFGPSFAGRESCARNPPHDHGHTSLDIAGLGGLEQLGYQVLVAFGVSHGLY
ncbi:hypothetical protein PG994_005792 [Apiospora phragmitis]|uniref:Uncharacterized protein n=1 Tax=Apiospora phragmitis TaxID=2905665 RepID=A0ABR1VD84_9PEZI